MTNITVVIDFTSKGSVAYTATLYVGMPGFNTVLKPGVFSLTQDERDKGFIAENWIDMFLRKRISTFAAIRQVAQKAGSFDDALAQLNAFELSGPRPPEVQNQWFS